MIHPLTRVKLRLKINVEGTKLSSRQLFTLDTVFNKHYALHNENIHAKPSIEPRLRHPQQTYSSELVVCSRSKKRESERFRVFGSENTYR